MRTALVLAILLVMALLASFASASQTITWGVALDGYVIERSYDGTTFKEIAALTPDKTSYVDTTAESDAPVGTTQVCYRVVPKLAQGPSFFNPETCTPITSTQPMKLSIIIDNLASNTSRVGTWSTSTAAGFFGSNSVYAGTGPTSGCACTFRWTPALTAVSNFQVSAWWTVHSNRSTTVPYRIKLANGNIVTITANQQTAGGQWNVFGEFPMGPGSYIEVSADNGQASADAVRLLEQ